MGSKYDEVKACEAGEVKPLNWQPIGCGTDAESQAALANAQNQADEAMARQDRLHEERWAGPLARAKEADGGGDLQNNDYSQLATTDGGMEAYAQNDRDLSRENDFRYEGPSLT